MLVDVFKATDHPLRNARPGPTRNAHVVLRSGSALTYLVDAHTSLDKYLRHSEPLNAHGSAGPSHVGAVVPGPTSNLRPLGTMIRAAIRATLTLVPLSRWISLRDPNSPAGTFRDGALENGRPRHEGCLSGVDLPGAHTSTQARETPAQRQLKYAAYSTCCAVWDSKWAKAPHIGRCVTATVGSLFYTPCGRGFVACLY